MKSLMLLLANPMTLAYVAVGVEGYPDAYTPELWAEESVAILEENMVVANLIFRDYSEQIQSFGDTVNTRKPGELETFRKTAADDVTVQNPSAVSIPVVLNQHIHTSFMIKDAHQSMSFKDLVAEYLAPAMLSQAQFVDHVIGAQVFQFLMNSGGHLNGLNGTNATQYMLEARQVLNQNKAYVEGRSLVLTTVSETALLSNPQFTDANRVGDDGTALRRASLGSKFGLDIFMAQNTPYSYSGSVDKVTGTINNGNITAGSTVLTIDAYTGAISNGTWVTIAGDDIPQQVTASVGGTTPTSITITPGLSRDVVDGAVVTTWAKGTVLTNSYASGWGKEITYTGFTKSPQVGQGVSFGTGTILYGIIKVNTTAGTILLDRPLEAAVNASDTINCLPAGSYNWIFHRNSVALVCRPLAQPMSGTGARSGIAEFNGLSMRVVFTYDGRAQGTLVTLDMLLGVKVLDTDLGAVMLG